MSRDGKDHPDRAGLPRTAWRLRGSESREHETDGDKRERCHGEPRRQEYTADSLKLVTAGAYAGKLPRWCGRVHVVMRAGRITDATT